MMTDISILGILGTLGDEYVLLKKPIEFPDFLEGSDIDILALDASMASEKIQRYLSKILDGTDEFLRASEGRGHIHLDIIRRGRLLVRVDLIDSFDFFTQFSIQDSLKIKIFLTREVIHFDDRNVFVPSHEFDLLIRYLEYLEWFERRPDKIKHVDHILANSSEEQRAQLINDLHRYIRFHRSVWQGRVPSTSGSITKILKQITGLYVESLKVLWKGLKSRIL